MRSVMGQTLQFLLFVRWVPQAAYPGVGAFFGPQGLCGRHCGVGFGHDAWTKRAQIETTSAGAGHRQADAQRLAPVVDADICAMRFLESRTGPFQRANGPGANAALFGASLWCPADERFDQTNELSFAHHDTILHAAARYVRGCFLPAEDAHRFCPEAVVRR